MPSFSRSLEQALHRALALANERHHEYATLEHLLLALVDDQDAAAGHARLQCRSRALPDELTEYIDTELDNLVTATVARTPSRRPASSASSSAP